MKRVLLLLILVLAGCASAAVPTPTLIPPTEVPPTDIPPTTEALVQATDLPTAIPTVLPPTDIPPEAPAAGANLPAWQTISLNNARTGETFTLADFAGKTVYIEPMATWCPNCLSQQRNVIPVFDELGGSGEYVFISLSVGENIGAAALAEYADDEGFDWLFAIASAELMQALSAEFGFTVLSPPSTPHFVIFPDGSFTELRTGYEASSQIKSLLGA